MKISILPAKSRPTTFLLIFGLLVGSTTLAFGSFNTPATGYILCVNSKTSVVTFPGTEKCPKGTTRLSLGAKGAKGEPGTPGIPGTPGTPGTPGVTGATGLAGAIGIAGAPGVAGPGLLTGFGPPTSQTGKNGDSYIDRNRAILYGPKGSDNWGDASSIAGPAGPAGATGPAGPAGGSAVYLSSYNDTNTDLNGYDGTATLVLTLPTVTVAGTYWMTLHADIQQGNAPVMGLCAWHKNGTNQEWTTPNIPGAHKEKVLSLSIGDIITWRCAGNAPGANSTNVFGMLFKIGS